jgi:hypothetical protein
VKVHIMHIQKFTETLNISTFPALLFQPSMFNQTNS